MNMFEQLIVSENQSLVLTNGSTVSLTTIGMESRPISNPQPSNSIRDGNLRFYYKKGDEKEIAQICAEFNEYLTRNHTGYFSPTLTDVKVEEEGFLRINGNILPANKHYYP